MQTQPKAKTLTRDVAGCGPDKVSIVAGWIRVLGIDPSLSCTGFAVLDMDPNLNAFVRRLGYIDGPDGPDLWPRVSAVADAVAAMMLAVPDLRVAVVETPMTKMGGVSGGRSRATLPSYGVAVGAIARDVEKLCSAQYRDPVVRLMHPSATTWASGLKSGGKGKPERIATVSILTGIDCKDAFGKTRAENVADAVLLARWAGVRQLTGVAS